MTRPHTPPPHRSPLGSDPHAEETTRLRNRYKRRYRLFFFLLLTGADDFLPHWARIYVYLLTLAAMFIFGFGTWPFYRRGAQPVKAGPQGQPVCVGDSLTQGLYSDDWVSRLPMKATNHGFKGGTTEDILGRVDTALSASPPWVALWCGTVDAIRILEPEYNQKYFKRPTSEETFQENYRDILTCLTSTPALLMTLPPLGEQPNSEANQLIRRMNDFIKAEAAERGLPCVDVYALLAPKLSDNAPAYSIEKAIDAMGNFYRRSVFLLPRNLDDLSDKRGMTYSHDYMHLNHRAGALVAEAVSETLAQQGWSEAA